MKAVNKFVLKMGKLQLPLACFKAVDSTLSVQAKEVAKIGDKIYKVQRKTIAVLEDGTEKDISSGEILKAYDKDNGELALFTKEEQSQLLKKGSSREWDIQAVVDKSKFKELDYQKDGIICSVDLDKKKEILNRKNLKFFAMLKTGLKDKVMVAQILYKNTEYPVAISNLNDKLLIRFVHYKDEVRKFDKVELPTLTADEQKQAEAFVTQFYKPDFDAHGFENKTEEVVLKLVNNRNEQPKDNKEVLIDNSENPFA